VTDEPTPDADFAEQLARISARRAARGLGPIVERDPDESRREWCQQHAAATAVYWGLAGIEPGIVAAVNYAATFGTGVHQLPRAIANTIFDSMDPDTNVRGWLALALHERAKEAEAHRVGAEGALSKMCRAVGDVLPEDARERLMQRLVGGDMDFWLRCRRASAMVALGLLRNDLDLQEVAMELVIRECHEKPALTPGVIFGVSGPIRHAYRDDAAGLDAALVAEIAAATAAMLYPDGEVGSW
jgi:hypothetical protein